MMARRIVILVGILAVAAAVAAAAALYMAGGKGPVAAGSAAAPSNSGPWGPETQLTAAWRDVWRWGIASSGRTVHMVWGYNPIHYRRSLDEGATWSADTILSAAGEPRLTDPLAAEGSNVYIVYLRKITDFKDWCCPRRIGDIYFRRSQDGGKTWEPEARLTTAGGAHRISLAVSGPRLDLVWNDLSVGNRGIFYRRSPDGGTTWDPEVKLVSSPSTGVGVTRPQVASLGDAVHVTWGDDRDGNPRCYSMPQCAEVYYKRSLDGGRTWYRVFEGQFGLAFARSADEIGIVLSKGSTSRSDVASPVSAFAYTADGGQTWIEGPTTNLNPYLRDNLQKFEDGTELTLLGNNLLSVKPDNP